MPNEQDLIIVGAGTAGIPAALEAAARGTQVLLLDKSTDVGGTLHVSGGHLSAAGTARQRAKGIRDTPQAHYDDVMRISEHTARPDLTRLAVELAPSVIDWLSGIGFDFAPETPRLVYGHEPYAIPRTYYGTDAARSILDVLRPPLARAIADHSVDLRLATTVTRLLIERGRCIGVAAVGPDGQERELRADAVIIATGGFGFDPDLFAELEGAPLVTAAAPTSTGDGLRMALAVGAGLGGRGTYLPTFGGLPPADGFRVAWEQRPLLVAAERPPWEIYVDVHGRRFVAEDEPSIDAKERALVTVPDMTFWTVFDARALAESRPMVIGWSTDDLDAAANNRIGVYRAETLAELATLAAIDPDGLAGTVQAYNDAVASGTDPAFGRTHLPALIEKPPFYAMQNHALTLITFTGVDVDADLAVRRDDGTVIEGLYAAGEVIGAGATSGNSFCGGMLITPALAFGRLLGQRLGQHLGLGSRSGNVLRYPASRPEEVR